MIIETIKSVTIVYTDKDDDTKKRIALRLGRHNYAKIDKNDPVVAQQLFVYRKHGCIRFDGLLPKDKELLDGIPEGPDRYKKLADKVHLSPSPVGRLVNGKPNEVKVGTPKQSGKKISKTRKNDIDSGSTWPVPGEGEDCR